MLNAELVRSLAKQSTELANEVKGRNLDLIGNGLDGSTCIGVRGEEITRIAKAAETVTGQ